MDLSDELYLNQRARFSLTVDTPAEMEMTSDEREEFVQEYCDKVERLAATKTHLEGWIVTVDGIGPVKGATYEQAVCRAAALLLNP
jgi:hypothetical protein